MEYRTLTQEEISRLLLDQMRDTLILEVEDYLKQVDYNRTQFAEYLGVSKGYVSQFLNGKGNYSLAKLISISLKIGKHPHFVFTDLPKREYSLPGEGLAGVVNDDDRGYGQPHFIRKKNIAACKKIAVIGEIDDLHDKISKLRPVSDFRVHQMIQKFRYAWNFNSNAIEGNELTYGETLTLIRQGLTAKGKPLKDHLDVQGHEKAVDMMLEMITGKRPLSQQDVRQLHQLLLKETYQQRSLGPDNEYIFRTINVGTYKRQPNHVRLADGSTFRYADPIEVPARMTDLLNWYNQVRNSTDHHPLITAVIFHHEFVSIHPFDDGNGRMARILMNYTLMQRGYPPIVVPLKKRLQYYRALETADENNLEPLAEYLGKHLLISLEVQLDGFSNGHIDTLRWDAS